MARSGSLGWVVIVGAISVAVSGALWGLFDSTFVDTLIATNIWDAPQGSVVEQGRRYVVQTWNWLLLIVVLRVGLEAMVASRLRGTATSLPKATMAVFIAHLLLVLWMLTIPEMGQPLYDMATNNNATGQAVADAGYDRGVTLAWDWGVGALPAILLLTVDVWYLSEPIRRDMLRR